MQRAAKNQLNVEMHPEVDKVLDKWENSKSNELIHIVGKILAELLDLEKNDGPNRGHDHSFMWDRNARARVHLWKDEQYEMFYRYEPSEPAVIVLHVCIVEGSRDEALKRVEERINWRL
jgi:hypothetical protein